MLTYHGSPPIYKSCESKFLRTFPMDAFNCEIAPSTKTFKKQTPHLIFFVDIMAYVHDQKNMK